MNKGCPRCGSKAILERTRPAPLVTSDATYMSTQRGYECQVCGWFGPWSALKRRSGG